MTAIEALYGLLPTGDQNDEVDTEDERSYQPMLSENEKRTARKMGVSESEFLASKAFLEASDRGATHEAATIAKDRIIAEHKASAEALRNAMIEREARCLSPDERRVAKSLGLTPEAYASGKI